MEAICSECNKTYQERKEELFCLIGEVPMICYECAKKYQPERSKREDDIMYLKCKCGEYKHVFADKIHMDRCGALNPVET